MKINWKNLFKSLFGEEEIKPNTSKIFKDKGGIKSGSTPGSEKDFNYFPESSVNELHSNPDLIHKKAKKQLEGYDNFKKIEDHIASGKIPEELGTHLDNHFRQKNLPVPENDFMIPADETRTDKVQKIYQKNYKDYASRFINLPELENWFKDTKKKFESYKEDKMKDGEEDPEKIKLNDFDFKHKENFPKSHSDDLKNALSNHKSALDALMHIEDPGYLASFDRLRSPEISEPFYFKMIKPFMKSPRDIKFSEYDMPKMKEWFENFKSGKKKLTGYDTYGDTNSKNFSEATGRNIKDYKHNGAVDNPFSPAELLHEYSHKTKGHKLYTPEYYNHHGDREEIPPGESEFQPAMFKDESSLNKKTSIQEYLANKKKNLTKDFPQDQEYSEGDLNKFKNGMPVGYAGLDYMVSGINKDKGTVELSNPDTNNLIGVINSISKEMSREYEPRLNKNVDITEALKKLHESLSKSNPEAIHPEAFEGGNYKTIREHLEDMSKNKGKYLTQKERELDDKVKKTASDKGIDLSKTYPIEGLQREMFENDNDFGKRFEKWKKDNPGSSKIMDSFKTINEAGKELEDYRKKNVNTPEHEKAVKSLTEDVLHTAHPDESIDADRYINVHKQVQKLGDIIKERPKYDAPREEWDKYNGSFNKYLEARGILESMHPAFTPEKLKERKQTLEKLHKQYGDLHRWSLTKDKIEVPAREVMNRSSKEKLKTHSWKEMSNVEPEMLKRAGISPQIIQHVADSEPELYENSYNQDKLKPEQMYLELYRKLKSHALHQVSGESLPLSLESLQNFVLGSSPLDKEQIRQKMNASSGYERKKLEHLLSYGISNGLFDKQGKKYVLGAKQVSGVTRKSLMSLFKSLFKKDTPPQIKNDDSNDEFFNESYPSKIETPGYDNDYQKNKNQNIVNNFRKDITTNQMSDFDEQVDNMDISQLIEYRSQLEALLKQFSDELQIRNLDDGTKTPYADSDFRDYMYMQNLAEKQLAKLNEKLLDKILNEGMLETGKPKEKELEGTNKI